MRDALKSRYAAEPCDCGRGDACPGASISDPASEDHRLCVQGSLMAIMGELKCLQLTGVTAEEVCEGFADDAVRPGRPDITADDIARIARLADVLGVLTDGLRAASELDWMMLNAQKAISPEVH